MFRWICFLLIVTGMCVIIVATKKFFWLIKNIYTPGIKETRVNRFLKKATAGLLVFFIIGYGVGALDVALREVEPIYLFVSIVFFFGGIFVLLIIQNQISMTISLKESNDKLLHALSVNEDYNLRLEEEINVRVKEVLLQDKLLHTINDVAAVLLGSEVASFEQVLWECMGKMAESVDADRMYIWKNHVKNEKLYCTQVYEWSGGADPQQGNEITIDIPYAENMPGWEETLSNGRCVSGPVRNLSPAEREQLTPQGILSILVVPVFLKDEFWGFIGFDDCHSERTFSEAEEVILRSGGMLVANAMLRNQMTQTLVAAHEQAVAGTNAKSAFLANMSHEIRMPINAITGMTTIARKSTDPARVNDCLAKIEAASRQLLGLINDILDMSKIEAKKFELAKVPFSLRGALMNVRSMIGVRASEKNQTFYFDIAGNMPEVVIGDEMRICQILINLLSNAVKFTPEEGDVSLMAECVEAQDGMVEFTATVRDTGIGISAEQIDRLWGAFEQADDGISRRFGGTGLGLPISKSLAELMDGSIEVASILGKGSTFTMRLILPRGNSGVPARTDNCWPEEHCDFSGYTALLVEDIEINREIVLSLFEGTGLSVECAENGREAVDTFSAHPDRYDIIYMDVHMPVMDGYSATRALRALDIPEARSVPILAMTANAFQEDIDRCKAAGMNDHLAKPIDMSLLFEKTAHWLCSKKNN